MSIATPPSIVVAFATTGDKNTVPVLASPTPGLASYTTGFTAINMIPRADGGVPPSGKDFNGVLYSITANIAYTAAGGQARYNADVITYATGYGVGAVLQSAIDPTQFFLNLVANNGLDPDVDSTNWAKFSPLATPSDTQANTIPAGSQTVSITGRTGFLDLTPSAGAATITNLLGGVVGQFVTITNLDPANSLLIQAGANIRLSASLTLLQNSSVTLRRRTLTQWVATS